MLKFGTEFAHGTAGILHCSRPKVQGEGYRVKYQVHSVTSRNVSAVKRYKTATHRLNDFKLGMGVVIKADKTGAKSGGLKLQCVAMSDVVVESDSVFESGTSPYI